MTPNIWRPPIQICFSALGKLACGELAPMVSVVHTFRSWAADCDVPLPRLMLAPYRKKFALEISAILVSLTGRGQVWKYICENILAL